MSLISSLKVKGKSLTLPLVKSALRVQNLRLEVPKVDAEVPFWSIDLMSVNEKCTFE